MNNFEEQVIAGLAELRTTVNKVEEHLRTLNGKVAKHEERIGQMLIEAARKEGASETTSKTVKFFQPMVYLGLAAFAVLIMEHAPVVFKWLK